MSPHTRTRIPGPYEVGQRARPAQVQPGGVGHQVLCLHDEARPFGDLGRFRFRPPGEEPSGQIVIAEDALVVAGQQADGDGAVLGQGLMQLGQGSWQGRLGHMDIGVPGPATAERTATKGNASRSA